MTKKPVKKAASKKASPKKTATKKAAVKRPAASSERTGLMVDLKKITDMLDETSLRQLIRQALILQHNMRVDEINKGIKEKTANKPGMDRNSIDVVEADDGSSFVLVVNRSRNFFARDEMKRIVNICHAARDERDGMISLYNFFKRERIDVINNTEIFSSTDTALKTMYNYIINTYTVRK
ncbi:MAG: hypothetical protein MUD12_10965 [Spirochaetes bacterium]|nr:hypothetical protein [Spirochaetota bacterium]